MILIYFSAFIFGLLLGNFTTTLLYRLPRNIIPYGFNKSDTKPPFCSDCKHPLLFYEYLPVLSWISTRGSCNYCDGKISLSYFYLEVACGFFAVLCVYLYSHNIEIFFLKFCLCATVALAFAIRAEHNIMSKFLIIALIAEGAFFRTLQDQSILPWLVMFCCAAIFSMALLQSKMDDKLIQEVIYIILPVSVWLEGYKLALMVAIVLLLYFLRKGLYLKLDFYNTCIAIFLILAI